MINSDVIFYSYFVFIFVKKNEIRNSKRVTRSAMLYIPNSLIVNKLSYFSLCFFTKFASNALKRPVNRHGFAAKASKKAEKRTLLVPFDSNRKPLKISLKYQT
ncbi:hypothetical protein GIHI108528_00010 [Gillisia hiemivivida]